MDDIRKELDKLLGTERNLPLKEKQKSYKHFDDKEVCCFYLIDFCPHNLFPNTKSDLRECKKRHDAYFRNQFQNNPNREQYRLKYEEILEDFLERLVHDVDIKIKKGIDRIEGVMHESEKTKEVKEQINLIDSKIEEYALQAERYGEQGLIEQSELVMKQIDNLKEQKNELNQITEHPLLLKEKQMKICEVCGGLQGSQDNPQRLKQHYEGKLHTGYTKIREVLQDLKIKKMERKMKREELKEKERLYNEKQLERMREKLDERNNPEDFKNYFDPKTFETRFGELGNKVQSTAIRINRNEDKNDANRERSRNKDFNKEDSKRANYKYDKDREYSEIKERKEQRNETKDKDYKYKRDDYRKNDRKDDYKRDERKDDYKRDDRKNYRRDDKRDDKKDYRREDKFEGLRDDRRGSVRTDKFDSVFGNEKISSSNFNDFKDLNREIRNKDKEIKYKKRSDSRDRYRR